MKIDIACGVQKKPGFTGLDKINAEGVDIVCDCLERLPLEDNEVEEVNCGDFIEHITYHEMIGMMNEIWRVCKNGSKVRIVTVFGIKGWLNHPPHTRPIFTNQFNYFTPDAVEQPTFNHMRNADGITSVFSVKKNEEDENSNLEFILEVVK